MIIIFERSAINTLKNAELRLKMSLYLQKMRGRCKSREQNTTQFATQRKTAQDILIDMQNYYAAIQNDSQFAISLKDEERLTIENFKTQLLASTPKLPRGLVYYPTEPLSDEMQALCNRLSLQNISKEEYETQTEFGLELTLSQIETACTVLDSLAKREITLTQEQLATLQGYILYRSILSPINNSGFQYCWNFEILQTLLLSCDATILNANFSVYFDQLLLLIKQKESLLLLLDLMKTHRIKLNIERLQWVATQNAEFLPHLVRALRVLSVNDKVLGSNITALLFDRFASDIANGLNHDPRNLFIMFFGVYNQLPLRNNHLFNQQNVISIWRHRFRSNTDNFCFLKLQSQKSFDLLLNNKLFSFILNELLVGLKSDFFCWEVYCKEKNATPEAVLDSLLPAQEVKEELFQLFQQNRITFERNLGQSVVSSLSTNTTLTKEFFLLQKKFDLIVTATHLIEISRFKKQQYQVFLQALHLVLHYNQAFGMTMASQLFNTLTLIELPHPTDSERIPYANTIFSAIFGTINPCNLQNHALFTEENIVKILQLDCMINLSTVTSRITQDQFNKLFLLENWIDEAHPDSIFDQDHSETQRDNGKSCFSYS